MALYLALTAVIQVLRSNPEADTPTLLAQHIMAQTMDMDILDLRTPTAFLNTTSLLVPPILPLWEDMQTLHEDRALSLR